MGLPSRSGRWLVVVDHRQQVSHTVRVIVLVVVLPLIAFLYSNSLKSVANSREGCERGNASRVQLYGLLTDLIESNRDRIQADGATNSEIQANRNALERYQERKQYLLDSIDTPVEDEPAVIDCEAAYPNPWPL